MFRPHEDKADSLVHGYQLTVAFPKLPLFLRLCTDGFEVGRWCCCTINVLSDESKAGFAIVMQLILGRPGMWKLLDFTSKYLIAVHFQRYAV